MRDVVRFIPLEGYVRRSRAGMMKRAMAFYEEVRRRRTVRQFSSDPVDRGLIEECLRAAGTAPSGANIQPWHFVAVGDPAVKRQIREAAELEEYEFYHGRAPQEWLEDLRPLGTDEFKPFLEEAPWLIAIFARTYGTGEQGERHKHYYVSESVGIATGMLITAIHHAGLACLTHTPSPMRFLNTILGRPANERAYMLLVVGHPAEGAQVPDISRKPLSEIVTFIPPDSPGSRRGASDV